MDPSLILDYSIGVLLDGYRKMASDQSYATEDFEVLHLYSVGLGELEQYPAIIREQRRLLSFPPCKSYIDILDDGSIEIIDTEFSTDDLFQSFFKRDVSFLKHPFNMDFHTEVFSYINLWRKERSKIIGLIKTHPMIRSYHLYCGSLLIARKVDGKFEVLQPALFKESIHVPAQKNVEELRSLAKRDYTYNEELFKEEILPLGETKVREYINDEKLLMLSRDEVPEPFQSSVMEEQFQGVRVISFLKGVQPLASLDLGQTPNSSAYARGLLEHAKFYDLALRMVNSVRKANKVTLPCSTYELRRAILRFLPEMPSYEAYCTTLRPGKIREAENWMNTLYLCTERVALHARMVGNALIVARSLHEKLPDKVLTPELRLFLDGRLTWIIAVRGNTGAGKSRSIGKGEGVINPDRFKAILRHLDGMQILNKQIHDEGIGLYFGLMRSHLINLLNLNYILDTRLRMLSDLEEMVINPAKARGIKAMVYDYDVPLRTSLLRVLTRDVHGDDPCPTLQAIVSGFKDIRTERAKIVKRIVSEKTVQRYHLYFKGKEIARKADNQFTIFNFADYLEVCLPPSEEEVKAVIQQVITEKFIVEAITSGDITEEGREKIAHWIGISLGDAVERHAKGEQ